MCENGLRPAFATTVVQTQAQRGSSMDPVICTLYIANAIKDFQTKHVENPFFAVSLSLKANSMTMFESNFIIVVYIFSSISLLGKIKVQSRFFNITVYKKVPRPRRAHLTGHRSNLSLLLTNLLMFYRNKCPPSGRRFVVMGR